MSALLDLGTVPERRDHAVAALAHLKGNVTEFVARALIAEAPAARLTAVGALARMRHPEASRAMVVALYDSDPAVRAAAVAAFGRLGTPAVAAEVVRVRDADPDPLVRRRAAAVCDRHGWTR